MLSGSPAASTTTGKPAFDDHPEVGARSLTADRELVEKLAAIARLSERDKETVKAVLDTFILKNRFQRLAGEAAEPAAAPKRRSRSKSVRASRWFPDAPLLWPARRQERVEERSEVEQRDRRLHAECRVDQSVGDKPNEEQRNRAEQPERPSPALDSPLIPYKTAPRPPTRRRRKAQARQTDTRQRIGSRVPPGGRLVPAVDVVDPERHPTELFKQPAAPAGSRSPTRFSPKSRGSLALSLEQRGGPPVLLTGSVPRRPWTKRALRSRL